MTTSLQSKKLYSSRIVSRFDVIDSELPGIFDEEIRRENSIFLRINKNIISKMAMFLCGEIKRPASVAITGETASGKSTITNDIIKTLENLKERVVTRINLDDYYYDRSEMVKKAGGFAAFAKTYDLDVPEALDLDLMKKNILTLLRGKRTFLPKYDMSGTAIRTDNHTLAAPSPVIIAEGLFVLNDRVSDAFDFKIYVDIPEDVKKQRFYQRAMRRGLGDSADDVYQNAAQKAKIHILPAMKKADIVLSGEADRESYKRFLNKLSSVFW